MLLLLFSGAARVHNTSGLPPAIVFALTGPMSSGRALTGTLASGIALTRTMASGHAVSDPEVGTLDVRAASVTIKSAR